MATSPTFRHNSISSITTKCSNSNNSYDTTQYVHFSVSVMVSTHYSCFCCIQFYLGALRKKYIMEIDGYLNSFVISDLDIFIHCQFYHCPFQYNLSLIGKDPLGIPIMTTRSHSIHSHIIKVTRKGFTLILFHFHHPCELIHIYRTVDRIFSKYQGRKICSRWEEH